MRRVACLLIGGLSGCVDQLDIALPNGDPMSLLVAVEGGAEVELWALSAEQDTFAFRFHDADQLRLIVLQYDVGLEALGIVEGFVPLVHGGRAIPEAQGAWVSVVEDGEVEWDEEDQDTLLVDERIAPFDVLECLNAGRCMVDGNCGLCDPDLEEVLLDPPALPELECPEGWLTDPQDPVSCRPPIQPCPTNTHRFFSGECVSIGDPCPTTDDFPPNLPLTGVRYVSETSAYTTIADAVIDANAGDIIAIAAGTYFVDQLLISKELELIGACAEEVEIRSDGAHNAPLFRVVGTSLTLRNLSLSLGFGAVHATGADVTLDGVAIGLSYTSTAVIALDTSVLRAQQVVLVEQQSPAIILERGSRIEAAQLLIDQPGSYGINCSEDGGTIVLVDTAIRNGGSSSRSIDIAEGCALEARDVLFWHNPLGISAYGGTITASSAFFFGEPSVTAYALMTSRTRLNGSSIRAERSGVTLGSTSDGGLTDLLLVDAPLSVRSGSSLTAHRVQLVGSGIEVGLDAHLDATDLTVRRAPGAGLHVVRGNAQIFRGEILISAAEGVRVDPSGEVVLERVHVHHNLRSGLSAVIVDMPIEVTVMQSIFSENEGVGLHFSGFQTTAQIARTVVEMTISSGTSCDDWPPRCVGLGLYVNNGAHLEGQQLRLDSNAAVGVQIDFDASIRLTQGVISNSPIGAVVLSPRVDIARDLAVQVQYRGNDVNISDQP